MQNRIVELTGKIGWIGGMTSRSNQMNKQIEQFNSEGWEVQQVILQGGANWIKRILRGIVFVITLFAYSKVTLGSVVLKK